MTTLLLILSLLAALIGTVMKKLYTNRVASGISAGFVYNTVCGLVAAAVLLAWGGFGEVSLFTALLGILFGAITALQGIANIAALQCGPMSYTSVIISFSTLISALSGVLFFHETLGWAQIVGMLLMLVSFVLATEPRAGEKRATWRWLALCLVAFFATGGIGIMQKVHQSSSHKGELSAFLILAFATSSLLCFAFSLLLQRRERAQKKEDVSPGAASAQRWLLLAVMAISGGCVAVNNKFNLYLSGVMDSAVFFPIVNGGGLVLATLAALLIFRERLSKRQWIGILFGIASVVFLCNPFG